MLVIKSRSSCSFSSTVMAFLSNMSEKLKPVSSSEIQVKNWQKTVGIEEKLDIVSQFKKVNELFPYAITLDSLIVACIQCVIMLLGLKKVLNQELKCLCGKTTTVLSE